MEPSANRQPIEFEDEIGTVAGVEAQRDMADRRARCVRGHLNDDVAVAVAGRKAQLPAGRPSTSAAIDRRLPSPDVDARNTTSVARAGSETEMTARVVSACTNVIGCESGVVSRRSSDQPGPHKSFLRGDRDPPLVLPAVYPGARSAA